MVVARFPKRTSCWRGLVNSRSTGVCSELFNDEPEGDRVFTSGRAWSLDKNLQPCIDTRELRLLTSAGNADAFRLVVKLLIPQGF